MSIYSCCFNRIMNKFINSLEMLPINLLEKINIACNWQVTLEKLIFPKISQMQLLPLLKRPKIITYFISQRKSGEKILGIKNSRVSILLLLASIHRYPKNDFN